MSRIIMLLDSCTTCLHTAVPNWRAVIRNRIYGYAFMKRLVYSSNALVLSKVTSDARYRSKIVRHWLKLFDVGMVVEIACAVTVDQFSHLVSFVVSIIIMLVSGYISQLCNAIGPTMFSLGLHMCLKIKFNNNNYLHDDDGREPWTTAATTPNKRTRRGIRRNYFYKMLLFRTLKVETNAYMSTLYICI